MLAKARKPPAKQARKQAKTARRSAERRAIRAFVEVLALRNSRVVQYASKELQSKMRTRTMCQLADCQPALKRARSTARPPPATSQSPRAPVTQCPMGHKSPARKKFCSDCGAPLQYEAESAEVIRSRIKKVRFARRPAATPSASAITLSEERSSEDDRRLPETPASRTENQPKCCANLPACSEPTPATQASQIDSYSFKPKLKRRADVATTAQCVDLGRTDDGSNRDREPATRSQRD